MLNIQKSYRKASSDELCQEETDRVENLTDRDMQKVFKNLDKLIAERNNETETKKDLCKPPRAMLMAMQKNDG